MNQLWRKWFLEQYLEVYCSGVFSDTLDKMGHRHQVSAGWQMNNPRLRLFGRARTVVLETVETDDERIAKGLGFHAGLEAGDVLVVKGSTEYAYFGELMTRLSLRKELAGTVIDGLTRDSYYTQQVAYPIFAKGYTPVDIKGRGRVGDVDVPVEIDGIKLNPGDYLFGDNDALVVIPADIMETESHRFNEAVEQEDATKKMIFDGTSIEDILKIVKEF